MVRQHVEKSCALLELKDAVTKELAEHSTQSIFRRPSTFVKSTRSLKKKRIKARCNSRKVFTTRTKTLNPARKVKVDTCAQDCVGPNCQLSTRESVERVSDAKRSLTDVSAAVALLQNRSSVKRRAAAKTLRKMSDKKSCIPLLNALRIELQDERTWETQYQLIMALGESGCETALPLIRELAEQKWWASMRQVAVGDALVRLGRQADSDPAPVFAALDIARRVDTAVAEGAMRAVAMLRLKFDKLTVERLIRIIDDLGSEAVTFWTAAACAGWPRPLTRDFLERCLVMPSEWTRKAAARSLKGEYGRYRPL